MLLQSRVHERGGVHLHGGVGWVSERNGWLLVGWPPNQEDNLANGGARCAEKAHLQARRSHEAITPPPLVLLNGQGAWRYTFRKRRETNLQPRAQTVRFVISP